MVVFGGIAARGSGSERVSSPSLYVASAADFSATFVVLDRIPVRGVGGRCVDLGLGRPAIGPIDIPRSLPGLGSTASQVL